MNSTSVTLDEWIEAMTQTMEEIATTSLRYPGCILIENEAQLPADWSGAYIPLVGKENSLHLGLMLDEIGCRSVAENYLHLTDSESISPEVIADSLRELVNVLAGGVKRRMNEKDATLQIGLPLIIHGKIEITQVIESAMVNIRLGSQPARLLLLRRRMS